MPIAKVNGVSLNYLQLDDVEPRAGREDLIMIHGLATNMAFWYFNYGVPLSRRFRVTLYDLRGHGRSEMTRDGYTPHMMAADLRALMDHLGIERAHFLSHSFGGVVALRFACEYPQRVASLMLVGAPALSDERLPPLPLRIWSTTPAGERRDAIHRHNLRTLMLARDASIDALAVAIHAANIERDRMRRRRLMLTDALRTLLPRIACPLAGQWGEHDVLFRGRLGLLAEVLPLARDFRGLTLVPGAGHWVAYEDAAAFDAALAVWLAALAGPDPSLRSGADRLR